MAADGLLCYGDFIMDFHVLIFIKPEKSARRTLLMPPAILFQFA